MPRRSATGHGAAPGAGEAVVELVWTRYPAAMRAARQRVAGVPAQRCSTRFGDLVYVDAGSGPVALLAHGIFGGHDNATEMVDLVLGAGYRTLGPSRFGYLGSAMPRDATVDDQADAYADLLDQLGVRKTLLVGYSAGGPSAIAFALRHPARVHGLILAAAYLPKPGRLPAPPRMAAALGPPIGVSSLGMFASGWAIPISPLTVMVTVGGMAHRPALVDGRLVERDILPLTLSIDHTVVDGAPAARFAATLVSILQGADRSVGGPDR